MIFIKSWSTSSKNHANNSMFVWKNLYSMASINGEWFRKFPKARLGLKEE